MTLSLQRPTRWPDPAPRMAGGPIRARGPETRPEADGTDGPLRRCLVTRECGPREAMIRFVVGPDGAIVPDLGARLPGRGLWLQSRRDIVQRAVAANAFARAARRGVAVPEGLADQIEGLLAARTVEAIGLARRAGQALSGFDAVRRALQRGWAAVLIVASDGSARERSRLPAGSVPGPIVDVLDAAELGSVFGRDRIVHAAIGRCRLADRFRTEAGRLAGFRPAEKS